MSKSQRDKGARAERKLSIRPCTLREAQQFVKAIHRHHRPPRGHLFSLRLVDGEATVGVVIVGRPVSRHQQDGETVEINRLCTDGTRNACSRLIGAAKRAARALHYKRMISYTLVEEPGCSWLASGMAQTGVTVGQKWSSSWAKPNLFGIKPRTNDHPLTDKRRWEISL